MIHFPMQYNILWCTIFCDVQYSDVLLATESGSAHPESSTKCLVQYCISFATVEKKRFNFVPGKKPGRVEFKWG